MGAAAIAARIPLPRRSRRATADCAAGLRTLGGPLVAVCGLAGGAGTSTLALLLARQAARESTAPVLLDRGRPARAGLACSPATRRRTPCSRSPARRRRPPAQRARSSSSPRPAPDRRRAPPRCARPARRAARAARPGARRARPRRRRLRHQLDHRPRRPRAGDPHRLDAAGAPPPGSRARPRIFDSDVAPPAGRGARSSSLRADAGAAGGERPRAAPPRPTALRAARPHPHTTRPSPAARHSHRTATLRALTAPRTDSAEDRMTGDPHRRPRRAASLGATVRARGRGRASSRRSSSRATGSATTPRHAAGLRLRRRRPHSGARSRGSRCTTDGRRRHAAVAAAVVPRVDAPAARSSTPSLAMLLVVNAGAVGVASAPTAARDRRDSRPTCRSSSPALSLAGGAYMHACKQRGRRPRRSPPSRHCCAASLLVAAAVLETYVSNPEGPDESFAKVAAARDPARLAARADRALDLHLDARLGARLAPVPDGPPGHLAAPRQARA